MRRIAFVVAALLISASAFARPQGETAIYESIVLPTIDTAEGTTHSAINNRGDTAGSASRADAIIAFFWSPTHGFHEIATDAMTFDLNNRGQVVGAWMFNTINISGFVWSRQDGFVDLGPFIPFAINDGGVMAGVCVPEQYPCIWKNGDIRPLSTDIAATPTGINARGDVVGSSFDTAFLWTRKGKIVTLGPGVAEDINNRGTIAGARRKRDELLIATVWTRHRRRSPTQEYSVAQSVNARGWVLVRPLLADVFVWNPSTDRRVTLRSSQGGGQTSAFDMNARGDVVGSIVSGSQSVIWKVRGRHMNAKAK